MCAIKTYQVSYQVVIKWIVIHSIDSATHPSNNCGQNFAPALTYVSMTIAVWREHKEVVRNDMAEAIFERDTASRGFTGLQ